MSGNDSYLVLVSCFSGLKAMEGGARVGALELVSVPQAAGGRMRPY